MTEQEKQQAKVLEEMIDGLNLPNFKGKEFTPYWDSVREGVRNHIPPQDLWPNIVPTLKVLQYLRTKVGKPLILSSTYRSPSYNAAVGGEDHSFHMKFKAIDFYCDSISPRVLWSTLKTMRSVGIFKGGLGLYKTFVHVDTRGYNADWTGSGVTV